MLFILFFSNFLLSEPLSHSDSFLGSSTSCISCNSLQSNHALVPKLLNSTILEVSLRNRSNKPIVFFRRGLESIEIRITDKKGAFLKEKINRQLRQKGTKIEERSWQMITVSSGQEAVVARFDLKSRFGLTKGKYTFVVEQRVREEGEGTYCVITSDEATVMID